eukprot:m.72093 g.72093  ORF g.72093 m.72093 type:complete len:69 (-) comp13849_c0_seq1:1423-1629(-)
MHPHDIAILSPALATSFPTSDINRSAFQSWWTKTINTHAHSSTSSTGSDRTTGQVTATETKSVPGNDV